ncbi:MAG: CpsB/CapC family capsule biosynthesis tyrosine phosphatase [Kiritimatiellia bacterium]|jgi:protein-tyrosine phosphatase
MIDLHAHVLPGLDDGAADEAAALALCRLAVADGIGTLVATPHLYGGVGVADPQVIPVAAEHLRERLAEEGIGLDLRWAAEVPLLENAVELYRSGLWPAYDERRRYLLLEMPAIASGLPILKETIFRLRLEGAVPILAHPERLDFLDDSSAVEGLRSQGALLQITAACLLAPGSRSYRRAADWIDRGWVQMVASDAHDPSRRPPRLAAARRWLADRVGEAGAAKLTEGNPRKILLGEPL